jgi:aryl-alcohol dehydrogenase-like predicted oxidoreductase
VRSRTLGRFGPQVSELSLGTWGLSGDAYGKLLEAEVDRTIDRAVSCGITLFDVADTWGKGAMEKRLGERLPMGITMVATKIGTDVEPATHRKRFDAPFLGESLAKSKERLKRDKIDVVLLHNPSAAALEKSDAIAFLDERKDKGEIGVWGVSCGSVEVAERALDLGAPVVEIAFNVFLAGDLQRLRDKLRETGAGVLARSVLAHGLLAGYWSPDREFYAGDHRAERWSKEELRYRLGQLELLRPCVGGSIPTLRSVALRFVLSNPIVTSAVLGPRSSAQLDQLVREAGVSPPYLPLVLHRDLVRRLKTAGLAVDEGIE